VGRRGSSALTRPPVALPGLPIDAQSSLRIGLQGRIRVAIQALVAGANADAYRASGCGRFEVHPRRGRRVV
jgi:hypothetical protein